MRWKASKLDGWLAAVSLVLREAVNSLCKNDDSRFLSCGVNCGGQLLILNIRSDFKPTQARRYDPLQGGGGGWGFLPSEGSDWPFRPISASFLKYANANINPKGGRWGGRCTSRSPLIYVPQLPAHIKVLLQFN